MAEIVLVSTSRYRQALLKRLGLEFRCVEPRIREEDWKAGTWNHRELAEHLAIAKAESILDTEPDATLIGSDQVVSFDGALLGKPGTAENAIDQLSALAGKAHSLITSVAVIHAGQTYIYTDTTNMVMRPLPTEDIARHVAVDQPGGSQECQLCFLLNKPN